MREVFHLRIKESQNKSSTYFSGRFLAFRSKNHLGNLLFDLFSDFLKAERVCEDFLMGDILRSFLLPRFFLFKATPPGARLMPLLHICLRLFRQPSPISSAEESRFPPQLVLSDEKSGGATVQQSLCGITLILNSDFAMQNSGKEAFDL